MKFHENSIGFEIVIQNKKKINLDLISNVDIVDDDGKMTNMPHISATSVACKTIKQRIHLYKTSENKL